VEQVANRTAPPPSTAALATLAPLIPRKIPCGIESFSSLFFRLPLIAEHIWVAAAVSFFLGVLRVIYSI